MFIPFCTISAVSSVVIILTVQLVIMCYPQSENLKYSFVLKGSYI
jgi:hypothetical protein